MKRNFPIGLSTRGPSTSKTPKKMSVCPSNVTQHCNKMVKWSLQPTSIPQNLLEYTLPKPIELQQEIHSCGSDHSQQHGATTTTGSVEIMPSGTEQENAHEPTLVHASLSLAFAVGCSMENRLVLGRIHLKRKVFFFHHLSDSPIIYYCRSTPTPFIRITTLSEAHTARCRMANAIR